MMEDFNVTKKSVTDGPDDDFIIKSGSGRDTIDARLEAAGIEAPQPAVPPMSAYINTPRGQFIDSAQAMQQGVPIQLIQQGIPVQPVAVNTVALEAQAPAVQAGIPTQPAPVQQVVPQVPIQQTVPQAPMQQAVPQVPVQQAVPQATVQQPVPQVQQQIPVPETGVEKSYDEAGYDHIMENDPEIDESEEELFAQIDEFRQKAARITALIREKQHRMNQLEEQLHEKEVENLRYQQKLLSMKKGVSVSTGDISLSKEVVAEAAVRAATEAVAKSDDRMSESLKAVDDKMSESIKAVDTRVSESFKAVEDKMSTMEKNISGSMSDAGVNVDFSEIKGDIFDKIHDENVRVYRNIQDFMKDRDENDERFSHIEQGVKKTGKMLTASMGIGLANLIVMVVVLLKVLGVF